MKMHKIIGQEVFCKRNGTVGVVRAQDELAFTIETSGELKVVTSSTFQRWYKIVPQENTDLHPTKLESNDVYTPGGITVSDTSLGQRLRERFIEIVKELADQSLDITYKGNTSCIKYNGKNVFELTQCKQKLNVVCHPKSLNPDNMNRATKIFPKSYGWSLTVKYTFTELAQWPLMRTIIVDGLFYRQKESVD